MKVPRWFVAAIAVVIVFAVPAGASASVSFVRAFGSHGAGDGQLADPEGIAIDGSNVFVVDGSSDRVVEFTTDGAFVRTWGWGVADGQHQLETCTSGCQNGISGSGDGQLTAPEGVAVSGGNVYVADSDDNRVVEYGSTGTFIRAWAVNSPYGIGTTPDGHLLVTDTADNTVQEFASDGTSVDTLATTWGSGDKLHFPDAVATAANGDIYVLDDFNQRVVQFSPAGSFVSAFGTSGTGSGQFQFPQGIAVDSNGHVVVSDTGNARLEGFDADGNFIESFGSAGSGNGQFNEPHGLAAGADGELAVADGNNFRVQLLNTAGGGEPSQHTLTVARAGTGSGTVTSTPAGIDCGSTCSVPMDAGDVVTLVPAPAPGSLFTGWSGGCTGIAACQITLDQDTAVTARFSQLVPDLTKAPAFQRIVAAVPAGALAPALHASSKLTLVGRATLAVDRHHRRTRTELRCAAATGKTCVVKATLSARIGRRKATLGTSTSRIAGQRIGTVTIALKSPALHLGHATVHATLTLHSTAKGLHATTVTQPVRLAAPDTAKPPVAETKEASGIEPPSLDSDGGPGGAVVAGVVNPEGAATSVHFEYGAAANFYPFSAPAAHPNLPADNVKELVTANLTQLWWGQSTIHYRVVAQSAGGTSFGADRTLHVPLVMPRDNSIPQPIDDVTVAGPVTLLSTGVQCSPLGPVVTGARLLCAGTAYNPQQSLWNVSSGSPVVVRPASGTLALHSSGGSDWAIGATSSASYEPIQFPAVVPTASGQSAPAQLIVMHPAGGQLFVQMLGGDGNASVTVVPTETPRLTATLTCRHKGSLTPGATVSCTASLANTGIDAADLDSFKLTGTHGLQPIATTAGAPPAVQQGSVNGGAFPTTTTEAFRIPKGARVGQAIDVTLVVTGRDETDRLPFVKTASASITVARPPSR